MLRSVLLDQVMDGHIEVVRLLQHVTGVGKCLCGNGIQHHIGLCHGITGANHTELKFITGKRKRGSAVPVCSILGKIRQGPHTGVQMAALDAVGRLTRTDKLRQHILQLVAQINRDNRRRSLVGAQTVIISHIGSRLPKQGRMLIHGLQDTGQHQQKLDILMGRFTRIQKIDAVIGSQRPVIVLTGTIDPGKRLLMKQTLQAMKISHLLQRLHNQLIVIHSHITLRINGSQFMLTRSHLIVLGLGRHAQLPQLLIYILHEIRNPLADNTEIMIIQLLSFRRHGAKQSPTGKNQILSLQILLPIHQEILLLHTYRRCHTVGGRIAK